MHRECAHCHRPFTPGDLDKEESKGMEAERKARGLAGMRFLYYRCPGCGFTDIFVDILRLEGETEEAFGQRKAEMEAVARQLHAESVEVVINAK